MDAALHKKMNELRAAGDRRVPLAEIADIVMNRLKCDVIMCIVDFNELEN